MKDYLSEVGDIVPPGTGKEQLSRRDLHEQVFIRRSVTEHRVTANQ